MNSGKAIHRTATLAKGHKTKAFKKQQRKDRARKAADEKLYVETLPGQWVLVKRDE